jgi:NAD(P)-dependent dehydrogenase (short-subunit alcohol dehydrogenase family)
MRLPAAPRAVITGAGSGFGRALALELAPRRAELVLGDVNRVTCEETARLALAAGAGSAKAMACDVTRLADVEALAKACDAPDLVVNNAGVASAGRVGELPIDTWHWTLDVDLVGVIHGCHVFVPRLRARGRGHLLNVASAAGIVAAPGMGAYNVAKAGVIALSETLAGELHGTKVGVTVLCPTFFKTNIAKSGRFADTFARMAAERLVDNGKSAEEVARAALVAVERGDLYSLPMNDALWLWRLKRLAPGAFHSLMARLAQRRLGRR